METLLKGREVLWRDGVVEIDYLKGLIELVVNKIVVCTFDAAALQEKVLIIIRNDEEIAVAIKNIFEKNKIPFEEIGCKKYLGLFILLLIWRIGFIIKKSEINKLEEAFKKAGVKIEKIERKEIKM